MFLQDLVRLVNTDRPYWLVGMTEMTRTFGLELLESILADFQPVFYKVITLLFWWLLKSSIILYRFITEFIGIKYIYSKIFAEKT